MISHGCNSATSRVLVWGDGTPGISDLLVLDSPLSSAVDHHWPLERQEGALDISILVKNPKEVYPDFFEIICCDYGC